ncbi:MAG TPA: oligosaccharide flippase family protein [Haliangium sp.]|nr:oligosaccharide flippase family protein [Haliangium sp.]
MSLAGKAVRGAVWTIGLSISARAVGMAVTIVLAYFLTPEVEGEAKAAWGIAFTAATATRFGLDQYLIVKQRDGDDVLFHCTFYTMVLGVLALGALLLLDDWLAGILRTPILAEYIPLAVIGVALRRMAAIPHRILIRDLRFRIAAVSEAVGELSYVGVVLLLAYLGYGGYSILIANIVQAGVLLGIVCATAGLASWLRPRRLSWQRTMDMLRFGTPLNFHTLLAVVSGYCDGWVILGRFGGHAMGLYSKAYSLADIPASYVGEHIGSVLLPSMAKIEPERRLDVLIRSTAILGILIFPMGAGLAIVADTLVRVLLPEYWHGVAIFLTVLASMSVFRPLSWVVDSYLKVTQRTHLLFLSELAKVAFLLVALVLAPNAGWAAVGVGLAFALQALFLVIILRVIDQVSPLRFLPGFIQPLLACVLMAAAVLGVRHALVAVGLEIMVLRLVIEIAVGAIVYVPAAFLCAPGITHDVLGLLRKAFRRGE